MAETSYPWNALPLVGDAVISPYDAENAFAEWMSSLAGLWTGIPYSSGIFQVTLGLLGVTAGVGQVSVDGGRAIVYGTFYKSTAATLVTIPTPAASTRIDLIVLRKSWALKTVRVTRIAGVEGSPEPSPVNTPGTEWDMPLGSVSTTTGGVITVTDYRDTPGTSVGSNFLMPAYPAICMASNFSAPTLAVLTATQTQVLFNLDRYKSSVGMHDTVTNSGRITIQYPGVYLITGGFDWSSQTSGTRLITIYKNGVALPSDGAVSRVLYVTAGGDPAVQGGINPVMARLDAGDYIEMFVYQNSGSTINVPVRGSGWMQVAQVAG